MTWANGAPHTSLAKAIYIMSSNDIPGIFRAGAVGINDKNNTTKRRLAQCNSELSITHTNNVVLDRFKSGNILKNWMFRCHYDLTSFNKYEILRCEHIMIGELAKKFKFLSPSIFEVKEGDFFNHNVLLSNINSIIMDLF